MNGENRSPEQELVRDLKAHYRVACGRQDSLHKMTIYLAKNYALIDSVGELGGVGPTRPHGRDKSGPYALAIASLGLFWQFANRVLIGLEDLHTKGM